MTKFRILPARATLLSLLSRISLLERFRADRSGNFAVMTAIAMVPLLAAAGVAVDVTMAMNMQTRLQQAADAAALTLARERVPPSQSKARQMAAAMLDGNFKGLYSGLEVIRDGHEWTISANTSSPNHFMHMFAGDSIELPVIAKAAHSTMSFEIALVLDTTGSMEGRKLRNLKEAATAMVTTMSKDIAEKERVKFALVPFSTFVNVGPQFAPTVYREGNGRIRQTGGAAWLDLEGRSTMSGVEVVPGVDRFTLYHHLGQTWKGCVETRQASGSKDWDTQDLPVGSDPRSLFVPAFHVDDQDPSWLSRQPNSYLDDNPRTIPGVPSGLRNRMTKYGIPVQNGSAMAHGNWVRPGLDLSKSNYYSNYDERKGPGFFCDSQPIVPLTTDYRKITEAVDELQPLGNTNVFEGVMWGWRSLSPGAPFTEGRAKDAFNNEKIIILLTDGNNAWNRISSNPLRSSYSSFGFLSQERLVRSNSGDSAILSAMDDKTLEGCANAKEDGITIYTIRLELDDSNSDGLLRTCASSPDHYFDVPDAEELEEAFEAIRYRINKIRLTR